MIVTPVCANAPSQAVDCTSFERNPNTAKYIGDVLPGEAPEPMPPGTRVVVKRIGAYLRARAFVPPPSKVN